MSIFNNNFNNKKTETDIKKIRWVIEYEYKGTKNRIVDYFPVNFNEAEARKYIEKKIGTFQFLLIRIWEY